MSDKFYRVTWGWTDDDGQDLRETDTDITYFNTLSEAKSSAPTLAQEYAGEPRWVRIEEVQIISLRRWDK